MTNAPLTEQDFELKGYGTTHNDKPLFKKVQSAKRLLKEGMKRKIENAQKAIDNNPQRSCKEQEIMIVIYSNFLDRIDACFQIKDGIKCHMKTNWK